MRLAVALVLLTLSAASAAGELLGDTIEQATRAGQQSAENARRHGSPADRAARQRHAENALLLEQREYYRDQNRQLMLHGEPPSDENAIRVKHIENEIEREQVGPLLNPR